jgi:hypothetical protein
MPRKAAKKAAEPKSTVERARDLLKAYAETCNIRQACRKAKVARSTHYKWLEKYPKYRDSFTKTKLWAAEYLESVAVERASVGWLEPVHYQGAVCGHVRRFSDGLMMKLLTGMMPEKYGIKRQEISGPQGAPIQAKIEIVFVRPGDVATSDQQR